MLLTDNSGITSFIRILFLDPKTYDNLLKFFNAKSYDLNELNKKWLNILENSSQVFLFEGREVLIGDHTKVAKEGRRMPAVKAQHQDSEDLGKPGTIFGHHFGMLGILIGSGAQKLCAPLQLRLHEGTEEISNWKGEKPLGRCERLIKEAIYLCKSSLGSFYLLLDRDFMNKNAIQAVKEHNAVSKNKLDLIGRCKMNVACQRELTEAEKKSQSREKHRGRPRKYSKPVKPIDWFDEYSDSFKDVELSDGSNVKILNKIEYWHNMKIQFVLVIDNGRKLIFYTTDLNLAACKVVELYKMRFSIEITFYGLKHIIHGFSYHFWVKDFEKLTKFSKDRLKRVSDDLKPRVIKCIERIERSANFAAMALGVIQILSLSIGQDFSPREIRYQRTYRHEDRVSVEQFQELFSGIFAILLAQNPNSLIPKIIQQFSKT